MPHRSPAGRVPQLAGSEPRHDIEHSVKAKFGCLCNYPLLLGFLQRRFWGRGFSLSIAELRLRGTCSVNAAHGLEPRWWLGKRARSEIRGIPRGARFCEGASSAFGAWTLMVAASLAPESVTIRTPCCSLAAWRVTDSTHRPAAMDRRGIGGVSAPSGVAARGVRPRPGGRRPLLGGSWLAGLAGVVVVVG